MSPFRLNCVKIQIIRDKTKPGAKSAIRATKILTNIELKRIAHTIMDTGLAYEALSIRSADHREAVAAMQEKRKPVFGKGE